MVIFWNLINSKKIFFIWFTKACSGFLILEKVGNEPFIFFIERFQKGGMYDLVSKDGDRAAQAGGGSGAGGPLTGDAAGPERAGIQGFMPVPRGGGGQFVCQ